MIDTYQGDLGIAVLFPKADRILTQVLYKNEACLRIIFTNMDCLPVSPIVS